MSIFSIARQKSEKRYQNAVSPNPRSRSTAKRGSLTTNIKAVGTSVDEYTTCDIGTLFEESTKILKDDFVRIVNIDGTDYVGKRTRSNIAVYKIPDGKTYKNIRNMFSRDLHPIIDDLNSREQLTRDYILLAEFLDPCNRTYNHEVGYTPTGEIIDEKIRLSRIGKMAEIYWKEIPCHYKNTELNDL